MARLNSPARNQTFTHEGAPAAPNLSPYNQLRRSVLSCLLWEKEFYEDGRFNCRAHHGNRRQGSSEIASRAGHRGARGFQPEHVPLLLLDVLSKTGPALTADTVSKVLKRADEPGELLSILWRNGRKMIPAQMRKGIAMALPKFDAYQLAKYDRDGAVKLRDVLRMVRPKPVDDAQAALWKAVKDRSLAAPDTWEVALSGGADKKESFERLIREGNLGYLALLRNLRNMVAAGVNEELVRGAILARKNGAQRVFPFRYVAAARAAPQYEPFLDTALHAAIAEMRTYLGKTIVLVDVSGSMNDKLSAKSDMRRIDAAAALAAIFPGDVRLFTFSDQVVEVPPRRGMAGVEAIVRSQPHGGTRLGAAVTKVNVLHHDRLIVITDEQSHDAVPPPAVSGYIINVASAKHGVGYGRWVHIDGFSEGVFRFIRDLEEQQHR